MGKIGVVSGPTIPDREPPPMASATLSTLFGPNGAVLFQNDAARAYFHAPATAGRPQCAFIRHFVDRNEARRLLDEAAIGLSNNLEARVYTRNGPVTCRVEVSPAASPGGHSGVALIERLVEPPPNVADDAATVRLFAQAGADWFWETDASLRFTRMSDRLDLTSTSLSAAFVGRLIHEPLPGIEQLDREALRRTVDRREVFRDLRFVRRDSKGRLRHLSVSGAPVVAEDGTFLGYRGTGRDRTAEIAAREHAARARALLIDAIESIPESFVLFDRNKRFVLCNNRFREDYAALAEALLPGSPVAALRAAAARAGLDIPALDRVEAATAGESLDAVIEQQCGDRWHHVSTRRTAEGGLALVQTDVTALKQHEAELAEKSTLLQATLDHMHQGILVNEADGRVVMWNQRFLEMNGLATGAIRAGMPAAELVRAAAEAGEYGPGNAYEQTVRRLAELRGTAEDVARVRPNGMVVEHHTSRMPSGKVIRTFTDITALNERERAIEDQRVLLAGTLANIDHGILVLDDDLRVKLWNRRVLELLCMPEGLCRVGVNVADMVAYSRIRQGLPPEEVAKAVAERLRDYSQDHVVTLPAKAFDGRIIERRRRALPEGGMVLIYSDITEAKEREREIAEKSALLAATLDSMDQGLLVLDNDLRTRIWNARTVELLNLPPEFLVVGQPLRDLIQYLGDRVGRSAGRDHEARVAERIEEYRAGGSRVMPDLGFNGLVIERRNRLMPDGGMVVTYSDITELVEREKSLEEKSTHLTAMLANMDQGMLVLDSDMTIRIWNRRVAELLHLPPDFLQVGMPVVDLMRHIGARTARSSDQNEREMATRIEEFRTGKVRMLDGSDLCGRVIERRSREMPDGGLVVTYTDVTEARHREDELAEKGTLLAATLDNMDQGLIVIDAEYRAKLWNNRLVEMFSLPPDVLRIGRPFVEILRYFIEAAGTPPDRVEAELAMRLVELEGKPIPVLDRYRPDGRVIERRRRVMPQGGSVITYGDVTERKRGEVALRRAKEEAEIASRSKTEFLANMSHELRTPLNAIIGFSDILARQIFGPLGQPRYIEYANDIRDSGQHLLNLINDVLDISKIEVNKVELSEEVIDIQDVIDTCLRLMGERANAAGVTLEVKTASDLPELHADDRRLKQILLNLVSNAVKFTPPGGKVEIRVEADTSGFRFIVADTGIGIAKADIATALSPFGQIDSSLARRYQGTGLGLPLARSMTELHGGRLEIESEPGVGTTITVWLPSNRMKP